MRDILFRGKRLDNGEWVYGSFCMDALEQFNGMCGVDGFIRLYDKAKGKMQSHEVDRETVGQYTGLTDKNGERIFEGDILTVDGEDGFFALEFQEDTARFVMSGDSIVVDFDNFWSYEVEVMGNIHDGGLEFLNGGEEE